MTRTAFTILAVLTLAGCGLAPQNTPGLAGASPRAALAAPATLPTRMPGRLTTATQPARRTAAAPVTTWPDTRPIGICQWADHSLVSASNPEGYFPQVMENPNAWGTQSIDRAARQGCQGILFYDIEGQRYPVPVTYDGHPFSAVSAKIGKTTIRSLCKYAAAKGLWVAFTFRQTGWIPGAQLRTISPAATLGSEFLAARDYYGPNVKGIYWDSNIEDRWWEEGGNNDPLNVVWLRRLRDIIGPDVLVMTEFTGPGYDKIENVAPIRFFNNETQKLGPTKGSPVEIIVPPSVPVTADQRAGYVEAMRGGAICWVTCTWLAEDAKWVPDAFAESQRGR
jgi:hypothetical protein